MSSIAYVTDDRMLEYHRLCRNHEMIFWRLSAKKRFTDFHHGDLLFFYARGPMSRRKGLIGYAHFDSIKKLSIRKMWDTYKDMTGYDSYEKIYETIHRAAKGQEIPNKMNCLYLTDVVFFMTPIYPKEVQLNIPSNLESYCYIDKEDPEITVRILRKAEEHGIDVWSWDSQERPEIIFREDALRHTIAMVSREIETGPYSRRQLAEAGRLAAEKAKEEGWERIRTSKTSCFKAEGDTIHIALPFVSGQKDKTAQMQQLFGRMVMYSALLQKEESGKQVRFEVLGEPVPQDVREMVNRLNERL